MKKDLALIVAAADGILSLQTGVGVIVNFFFEAFEETKEHIGHRGIDLYAMCPAVNKDSADYNPAAAAMAETACRKNNGSLRQLINLSSGNSLNEIWKGTAEHSPAAIWDSCCKALAFELSGLSGQYHKVYVLLHDTLFVNVSAWLPRGNIRLCWIPHSLGTLFEDPNQQGRIQFEKEKVIHLLRRGDKIGFISHYTRRHLQQFYDVPDDTLVSFYSGIYFDSEKYTPVETALPFYERYGIGKDKHIIFTWGRCSDQKGIDIIIEAYQGLLKENPALLHDIHLFLLCPTETTYPEYRAHIRYGLEQLPPGSFTFVDTFQSSLQYEILRYPRLKIILLCSRYESFGLASVEALYQRHSGAFIIYSALPTFEEVLRSAPRTIRLTTNSPACLSKVLSSTASSLVQRCPVEHPPDECPPNECPPEVRRVFSIVQNHSVGINHLIAF